MATNTKFARGCVWLAISIIVVVSLGLLAAGGYFLYRGNQLDAEIARIRAAGDPVELADLGHNSGPLPAPTEDAAALLERAAQPMAAFERELVAAQVFDSPAFKAQTLDEKSAAAIRESLLAFPDLMPLLEQAAKAPHYRTQVDLQLPPDAAMEQLMEKAGNNRAAVRLLDLRARLLALEGEHDEAFQQGLYALRLSRHFSEEPTMVSYLVALAARGIGVSIINRELRCDVSDESRAALHQWLDEQDVAAEFVVALKHERAFGLAKTRTMGPFSGGQSLGYLQAVNGLIASVEQNGLGRKATVKTTSMAGAMILPAMQASQGAALRTHANLRCLRVLDAVRTLPLDATPTAATLNLPKEHFTDPYTNGDILLKAAADGWIVYTTGDDRKDNGGRVEKQQDVGLAPPPSPPSSDSEP